ncbi:hypothetical protein R80B4_02123 [Fibrobacteres bacterium R8-0-B4]
MRLFARHGRTPLLTALAVGAVWLVGCGGTERPAALTVEAKEMKKNTEKAKRESERRNAKISGYFIDSRNGKKYRSVKIGGKTWMAQNLNYQTGNSWCYDDDKSNCKKYGRLYDWNTAKTACPAGWHLPTHDEWTTLAKAAGGTGDYGEKGTAGKALKSISDWRGSGGNSGTDEYGWSALPGGHREYNGDFKRDGETGCWWTATESKSYWSDNVVIYRSIDSYYGYMSVDNWEKDIGFSVRCVKNLNAVR